MVGPRIAPRAPVGAPRPLPRGQARVNALLRGADSDGRVALMDNRVGANGSGPPLHHHGFDEAFYVLEGELTFQLGEQRLIRHGGELVFAPRGAPTPSPTSAATPAR